MDSQLTCLFLNQFQPRNVVLSGIKMSSLVKTSGPTRTLVSDWPKLHLTDALTVFPLMTVFMMPDCATPLLMCKWIHTSPHTGGFCSQMQWKWSDWTALAATFYNWLKPGLSVFNRSRQCIVLWQFAHSLLFTDVVIKKRREDLKDEKELNRIQAKRGLDFLDLILLAKVSITREICYRLLLKNPRKQTKKQTKKK